VEQPAAGRLEGVGPPAEVDGGSTAAMKVGHVAGLKASVNQAVLGWSPTIRPRQRPLLPLLLQAGTTRVLLLNRGAHKLIQGTAPVQRQVLRQHRTEPLMEK
jgi:hypothetical protein